MSDSKPSSVSGGGDDVLSIIEKYQNTSRAGFMPANIGGSSHKPQLRNIVPGHILPSIDPKTLVKKKSKREDKDLPSPQTPIEA